MQATSETDTAAVGRIRLVNLAESMISMIENGMMHRAVSDASALVGALGDVVGEAASVHPGYWQVRALRAGGGLRVRFGIPG